MIGTSGGARLGDCNIGVSVCVEIDIINSLGTLIGGGGGALVGEIGVLGGLRGSSKV